MSQPLSAADVYLEDRAPSVAEFTTLIQAVGWEQYTNLDVIGQALTNSLFCTVAMQCGRTIGMGRLVGDGVRFVYVQDVAVLPDFQKQGVGTLIMDRLMRHISETAPNQTYVHLFTDPETAPFYARYGFKGGTDSFYGMSVKKFTGPLKREENLETTGPDEGFVDG